LLFLWIFHLFSISLLRKYINVLIANKPRLGTPGVPLYREHYCKREPGTAMSYGCNVNIKGVSSHENSDVNAIIFNTNQRSYHSHGRRNCHRLKVRLVKSSSFSMNTEDLISCNQ